MLGYSLLRYDSLLPDDFRRASHPAPGTSGVRCSVLCVIVTGCISGRENCVQLTAAGLGNGVDCAGEGHYDNSKHVMKLLLVLQDVVAGSSLCPTTPIPHFGGLPDGLS
jgi:hypothetical protein